MAFRFASVTEEQILSINEVTVPKLQNWQQTVAVFNGKLFNLSKLKMLCARKSFALVWCILKQLFTSVSVKVVDIYLAASWLGKYPPLFSSTLVNNC